MTTIYQRAGAISGPAFLMLFPESEEDQRTLRRLDEDGQLSGCGFKADYVGVYEHATILLKG